MSRKNSKLCIIAIILCLILGSFSGCKQEQDDNIIRSSTPESMQTVDVYNEVTKEETSKDLSSEEDKSEVPAETDATESPAQQTEEPVPVVEKVTDLPAPETINVEDTPLLYDFVYGVVDWHVPVYRDTIDAEFYMMRHSSSPEIVYSDWYVAETEYTFPPYGQTIEKHVLTEEQLEEFEGILAGMPEEYFIYDGEWEMILYHSDIGDVYNYLWTALDYTESTPHPFLEDESGWPTEMLRREPYVSRIKAETGMDMNDPWWDMFRYKGKTVLKPNKVDQGEYYIVCVGTRVFDWYTVDGDTTHHEQNLSWDEVQERCIVMNYRIDGIYNDAGDSN